MFLFKNESEALKSNIQGYKAKIIKEQIIDRENNSLKYMATHWVFNYLSMKPVKQRLSTSFQKETLLIQIADELSKVPEQIYQTLDKKGKDSFIEDINEYFKDNDAHGSFEKSKVVHPVIRKRYEDKFNYFALRYLDEFIDFPTLRFQIYLGNYVHDKRVKHIEGTEYKTERIVKEKINVFEKLSKVSDLKNEYFQSTELDETAWEMFPNPSYNFVGNNIPIFVDIRSKKTPEAYQIDSKLRQTTHIQRQNDKLSKQEIVNKIKEDLRFGNPTAILSLNELPALLYEHLVNNKSGKEIEEILINKLIERYNTINNFKPEAPLPTSQITKKLRRFNGENSYDIEKLIRAMNHEINVANYKLDLVKKNEIEIKSKKRKYVFYNKEIGREAVWLANDIKRFMPKEIRSNWKGYQHSQLQELLAFYNIKQKETVDFLKAYWDFDNDNYLFNSILQRALSAKSFESFYKVYLEQRRDIFEGFRNNLENFKNNKEFLKRFLCQQKIWNVFNERLFTNRNTDEQIKQLLLKPLVFPRGVFDSKPTYIKGKDFNLNPELYASWYQYIQDESHEFQRFYELNRDYTELYRSNAENANSIDNKYNLNEQQKKELFIRKWEKKIKGIKGQDLLLLLIFKRIYEKMFASEIDVSLKDFYLTQEERLETQLEADRQSQRIEGDSSENIVKEDFIWNKTVPFHKGQIQEPAVKLKDIGKFRRYIEDDKVEKILSYDTSKIWTKLELESELESYEKIRREEVFKSIQLLEKHILEMVGFDGENHPKELEQSGNPNFKKYILFLFKNEDDSKDDLNWLDGLNEYSFETEETINLIQAKSETIQNLFFIIYLRNKFAHNQLPMLEYYKLISNDKLEGQSISQHILMFLKNRINKLI